MSNSYPIYDWSLEPTISYSKIDSSATVVGNPALVIDQYQNTYFAAVVVGFNSISSPTVPPVYNDYQNIVVGSTDINGNILWYRFFNELVVAANQTEVSLAIGKNNDLYVAFVTPANIPGSVNMNSAPNWCPPLYPQVHSSEQNDIVLARINYSNTQQTVAWAIQNSRLNSVYGESVPKLAVDTNNSLLYITYQTDGDVLCYTPIGNPTVVLSCFTMDGVQLWLECQDNINSVGSNTNPVVASDLNGGVYVAYETTATVNGGQSITNQQVEMVKFQTYLTPQHTLASYSRQWVLSQNGNIVSPDGTCSSPSLTCDGTYVFIAFLSTGQVAGNTHTVSANDLIVAKITPDGFTPWVQQGTQFNQSPYTYQNVVFPFITQTDTQNLLVSLQGYSDPNTPCLSSAFVFKLSTQNGNPLWNHEGFNNMPIAFTYASPTTALLPTANNGTYSQIQVAGAYSSIYIMLGSQVALPFYTLTSCYSDLILIKYQAACFYPNTSPFEYMSVNKKICGCGAKCCCGS